jgi:hypothetical protein
MLHVWYMMWLEAGVKRAVKIKVKQSHYRCTGFQEVRLPDFKTIST